MKIRTGFVSNSSSSCFICGRWGEFKYNIEEITAILQKILDFYNDLEGVNLPFDSVFKVPRIATEEDLDLLKYYADYYNISMKDIEGKTLIYGAEDNSIPYVLFELIANKFNAERMHLG